MRRDHLTGELFNVPRPVPALPGSMDYRSVVAHLLSEALQRAGSNRFELAGRISALVGKDVSKWMLDGYTAEAREEFNLPFYLVPAIESACCTHAMTEWLASVRGARVLIGEEALHHDLSRLQEIRETADAAIKALKQRMGRR